MHGATPAVLPALNRYALYKAGTVKLLDWLISTSAFCGYGDPKNPPKSPVPVSRLLRCAETISEKKPAVHIPGNITELIDDVIKGRELYAEMYASTGEEDESHRHFIDVLWEVSKLLRDARKRYKGENPNLTGKRDFSGKSSTSVESASSSDHDNLANVFTHLGVEEPSEKPFSTPEKRKNKKKAPKSSTLATTPEEERKMALVCHLEDMVELRRYIRNLWEDFAAGNLSLDVVGTTTELAFGCMRRAEENLDSLFEVLGGDDKMAQYSTLAVAFSGEIFSDPDESTKHREELLCLNACLMARTVKKAVAAASHPHQRFKYRQDKAALEACKSGLFGKRILGIVPDLVCVSDPLDEFATEFLPCNEELRIFSIAIIQSYMEIYRIIGDPALIVPQALENAYNRAMKSVDRCFEMRDRVRNPFPFSNLWKFEVKVAEAGTFLEALRVSDTAPQSHTNAQARIFKALPVAAIERIKYLKWGMNVTASRVANDGWNFISMSYLYRASHHYGMMKEKWEDLEWLITRQSKVRPYIIEVAEHADEDAFSRHHRMAWGIGTGLRPADDKQMGKCMQNMRKIEPLLDFPARMELESQSQDRLGHERGEMAEVVLRKMAFDKFFGKGYKNVKKQEGKRFTNIELLETYKESFVADEPEYNMDLLGLWSDLAELMQSMHKFLYTRLMNDEMEPGLTLDAQVVKPLLEEAAYYKKNGMPMNKPHINMAAKMMEKHVRSRGGHFLKEAMGLSSGHILEEDKPKIDL